LGSEMLRVQEKLFSANKYYFRARDVNQDIYAFSIDYQKMFDKVEHEKLIEILNIIGIDKGDLRMINNLYLNQITVIRSDGELSEDVSNKRS